MSIPNLMNYAVGYSDECRRAEEMLVKRVPLKLEQKLTIVKLQMFQEHFNAADDEHKDAVTMTQFRRAVRRTCLLYTSDAADE